MGRGARFDVRVTSCLLCFVEFREAFDIFDDNGDGKISREELTGMMTRLGQITSEEEITSIMKKADKDCMYFVFYRQWLKFGSRGWGLSPAPVSAPDPAPI